MEYGMLDLNTFGASPAAHHLVRYLNDLDSPDKQAKIRSVGIAVKSVNKNLDGIREAFNSDMLTSEVAANLLRLLRLDAGKINVQNDPVLTALTKNVVIGNIKRRIRQVTILQKMNKISDYISNIDSMKDVDKQINGEFVYYYYMGHLIGYFYGAEFVFQWEWVEDPITPESLHQKSELRRAKKVPV
jgi:hypothetical protein